jgi:hypothetical protein
LRNKVKAKRVKNDLAKDEHRKINKGMFPGTELHVPAGRHTSRPRRSFGGSRVTKTGAGGEDGSEIDALITIGKRGE